MMQLVLLGTGTPNACYFASGPSAAVIVNNQAYLIDFGPGVVRQANRAYFKGVDALRCDKLNIAFCTHLHSDHTAGLSDLIFTPWVLERNQPLSLYGPNGLQEMTDHITRAYAIDIDFRLHGQEKANTIGYQTKVTHIKEGKVYEDENVAVYALRTSHGTLESYAYKFIHNQHSIVISGDTCPLKEMEEFAKDADILLHEVEYTEGLASRDEKWRIYHANVHTLSKDLGQLARYANVKQLITTHRIYHTNMLDNTVDIEKRVAEIDEKIITEIHDGGYTGNVINGHDCDIFTI